MTRLMLYTVVLASLLQLNPRSSSAATVAALTFDTLIEKSEYVVYGRAVGTRSFWDPATSTIWTETELLVFDGAKGRAGKTICDNGARRSSWRHSAPVPGYAEVCRRRRSGAFLVQRPREPNTGARVAARCLRRASRPGFGRENRTSGGRAPRVDRSRPSDSVTFGPRTVKAQAIE